MGAHHSSVSRKDKKIGLHPHIDSNCLIGNLPTGPGLQILHDGEWKDAYIPDHMIVTVGFLGWVMSGYMVSPCIHRVKTVEGPRSVIVFSPGSVGEVDGINLCMYDCEELTKVFFELFDSYEVDSPEKCLKFRDAIFSKASSRKV